MTDEQIKEEIKHINTRNQEYIAINNRMTKKIIGDVDVSGCKDRYLGYSGSSCQNTGLSCPDIKCENNKDCYYKQFKHKEQECEELKRLIAKQKNAKIQLSKLKDKQYKEFCDMKQTLIEIKEIAEKHKATAHCDYLTDMDEILQKINEVIE